MRVIDLGRRRNGQGSALLTASSEWKLEETTGTSFVDSIGGYNGTVNDASLYTSTGKVGSSFDFTGKNHGNIVTGSNSDFEIYDGVDNKPFSVAFWHFQPTGTGASFESFFRPLTSASATPYIIMINANLLTSEINLQSGGKLTSIVSVDSFNNARDVWKHITFSFNPLVSEHSTFYINGVKATQTVSGTNSPALTGVASLRLGHTASGKMDEIKYYKNKALTESEALSIYSTEL